MEGMENNTVYCRKLGIVDKLVSHYDEISRITTAIAYNDLVDERLFRLESLLKRRLRECRQKLKNYQVTDIRPYDVTAKRKRFKYTQCGIPYFKDCNGWRAPNSDEAHIIEGQDMIQFYESIPNPWTVRDKRQFLYVICIFSYKLKYRLLEEKIRKNEKEGLGTVKLKKRCEQLRTRSLAELSLPIDEEYDWYEIADILDYRHKPQEYSALWKLELHPSINNKMWQIDELATLKSLILHYKNENWDVIAKKLNTGRTAYQCFMYSCQSDNKAASKAWSDEEDIFLSRLVDAFRVDDYIPWTKVANSMENRTEGELITRWQTHHLMKGRFLPEEDHVLLLCVKKFGENFNKITRYLKRSPEQLLRRYKILQSKHYTSWDISEDIKLMELTKNSTSINYCNLMNYFQGKHSTQIRARHLTLLKWRTLNPGASLITAPRRIQNYTVVDNSSNCLATALENLHEKLEFRFEETVKSAFTENDTEIMKFLQEENFKSNIDDKLIRQTNGENMNLQLFQLLLRVVLDKELINFSCYSQEYKNLLGNIVVNKKIRSYSKKSVSANKVPASVELPMPDLWGNKFQGSPKFIFPPNINTLIACKKILSTYHKCKLHRNKPIKAMCSQNMFFNEQWSIFLSRFKIIFLWPFRLSLTSDFIRRYKDAATSD